MSDVELVRVRVGLLGLSKLGNLLVSHLVESLAPWSA